MKRDILQLFGGPFDGETVARGIAQSGQERLYMPVLSELRNTQSTHQIRTVIYIRSWRGFEYKPEGAAT